MTASMASPSWLSYWLAADGSIQQPKDLKALRVALGAHGVNARGVRLYLDYGDRLFAPLGPAWIRKDDPALSLGSAIAWLKLLQACEMDLAPPPELARVVAACCRPPDGLDGLPVGVLRAAWRGLAQAAYHGQASQDFVLGELKPVIVWAMRRHAEGGLDQNQLKQGWGWLRQAWQDDCRRKALPPTLREWASPCLDALFKGVRMIPLTSRRALEDESEVMKHCIARYFHPGMLGKEALVFSARDPRTLDRLATVALCCNEAGHWTIDDIKAESNRAAPAAVHVAAQSLVTMVNVRVKRRAIRECVGQ